MLGNDESSLQQQFAYCENIIEDLLHDRLGDSKSQQRNDKLRNCVERLQLMSKMVENLSLFSTNDQVEELPTTSLRYLLVPAYYAYILQEINVELGKRAIYLNSAEASYREFLQNLVTYGLINFKIPWVDRDENNSKIDLKKDNFEDLSTKRQQKISRLRQMEELENALDKLRVEERRDDDEAAKLRVLEQANSCFSKESTSNMSQIGKSAKFTPFILTRTEQQKKVFGLGYPSIPTVSVDEWFDEMQKTGGFGNIGSNKRQTIQSHNDESSDEDDETKRQSKIRMDEWKDINPRGWGNTLNKG
uniref:TAP42 domain-containing protein n=1 Tax=Meloidogyne hapla TaxID=6305 RepID=A0A1I8BP96_MELHA